MARKVALTGATGNIGSIVVPALIKAGAEVTALVRDSAKAKALEEQGVKTVQGEYSDADAVKEAFAGADAILMIAPPNPDAANQMSGLIKAAKESGNPHVVRMSAIGAAADAPTDNGKLHHVSDEELKATGLPYTILRPHFFMQNIFMSVPTIKEQGNMYWGMGDGSLGMVDVRDIADASIEILLNGGHEGKTYTPTGPDSITFKQVADTIGKHLDKEVNYVPISYEETHLVNN